VRQWVAATFGVRYSYQGMYSVLARWAVHPKGPWSLGAKADLAVQVAWQQGLTDAPSDVGLAPRRRRHMLTSCGRGRAGRCGGCWHCVASRGASRGPSATNGGACVGVDPSPGMRPWVWLRRMRAAHLRLVLEAWQLDGVVCDGSGTHRRKHLAALPPRAQPRRADLEIRHPVEGHGNDTLATKQGEVDAYLQELAVDSARVTRLCGWDCIVDAFARLPAPAGGQYL
jgi:hypothetical protein